LGKNEAYLTKYLESNVKRQTLLFTMQPTYSNKTVFLSTLKTSSDLETTEALVYI